MHLAVSRSATLLAISFFPRIYKGVLDFLPQGPYFLLRQYQLSQLHDPSYRLGLKTLSHHTRIVPYITMTCLAQSQDV